MSGTHYNYAESGGVHHAPRVPPAHPMATVTPPAPRSKFPYIYLWLHCTTEDCKLLVRLQNANSKL